MTYLGTRPPTVDEWEKYELHHRSRMSIKLNVERESNFELLRIFSMSIIVLHHFSIYSGFSNGGENRAFILILSTCGEIGDEVKLDVDSLVFMNMWGLTLDFLKTLEEGFKEFFEKEVPANPLKAEYRIPTFIGELLSEGKMSVKVLRTNDTWYGMTYKEDVAAVKERFSKMLENGTYKGELFSDL